MFLLRWHHMVCRQSETCFGVQQYLWVKIYQWFDSKGNIKKVVKTGFSGIQTHASKSIDLVLNALPCRPLEIYSDRKLK